MSEALSSRACETCRRRRVKCDKRLPTCARCDKFGEPCPGYRTARRFFDDGAKVRRRFATQPLASYPSTEQPPNHFIESSRSGFDAHLSRPWDLQPPQMQPHAALEHSASSSTQGVPLDALGSARQTGLPPQHADPIHLPFEPTAFGSYAYDSPPFATLLGDPQDYGLWDIRSVDTSVNNDYFDLDLEEYYANGNNHCGFIPGVPAILSDEQVEPDDLEDTVFSSVKQAADNELVTGDVIEARRHETAALLRHFVENIACWMDVFDLDEYFTRVVPLKASSNAMIRSAVAAVVSKIMAQGIGQKLDLNVGSRSQGSFYGEVDWFYKAASHYDKGLSHLRYSLRHWFKGESSIATTRGLHLEETAGSMIRRKVQSTRGAEMENLLSAVSVLNLYESLGNRQSYSQHSNGFQSLLTKAIAPGNLQNKGDNLLAFGYRRGGRASFWNFALEDISAAYASRTCTRLDPGQLELFRMMGLSLDYMNRQQPFQTDMEREDAVAYALVWLTMRTVNYVAPQQHGLISTADTTPLSPASGSSTDRFDRRSMWNDLSNATESWYNNLPMTFEPYASIPVNSQEDEPEPKLMKLFFSIPICAATLQLYHFSRILLILNEPTMDEANNPAKRLRAFRQAAKTSVFHARQICNIALGNPAASVQRQMLQSLHLAGQCFEEDADRSVVVDLLRSVEKNTGCSTQQIIERLRSEWG